MQLYDITIAPNTTRQLDAPGSYFYYYSGSAGGADSTITMRGLSSGLRIVLKPGQAFRLPRGENETSWVLTNFSNTATIIGTVIVGDGDITDNRVTGSVEVIDGGKNRTMANQAFIGYGYAGGGVAQCSYGQLWNPISSGKKIIVEKFTSGIYSGSVPAVMNVGINNAAIGTVQTYGKSKLSGGTQSAAEFRTDTNANTPGIRFPTSLFWDQYIDSLLKMWEIEPKEPFVINPGYGIVIGCSSFNTGFTTNIEFYEESI